MLSFKYFFRPLCISLPLAKAVRVGVDVLPSGSGATNSHDPDVAVDGSDAQIDSPEGTELPPEWINFLADYDPNAGTSNGHHLETQEPHLEPLKPLTLSDLDFLEGRDLDSASGAKSSPNEVFTRDLAATPRTWSGSPMQKSDSEQSISSLGPNGSPTSAGNSGPSDSPLFSPASEPVQSAPSSLTRPPLGSVSRDESTPYENDAQTVRLKHQISSDPYSQNLGIRALLQSGGKSFPSSPVVKKLMEALEQRDPSPAMPQKPEEISIHIAALMAFQNFEMP